METKFTVIISLHKSDKPDWFYQAAVSVLDQTVPPTHMLITIDGELDAAHEQALKKIRLEFPDITYQEVRRRAVNSRGIMLGDAVSLSPTELVAIMDADDIAEKNRFERQLMVFSQNPDVDVCGTWIREISPSDPSYSCYRKVPEQHAEIAKYAKFRNPINNMTVMFRKSVVIAAGNYQGMRDFADYSLWMRMLSNGAIFRNIPEVHVVARAGADMVKRRNGFKYMKHEYYFYRQCVEIGFLSIPMAFFCLIIRAPLRLLGSSLLARFFKRFLRD